MALDVEKGMTRGTTPTLIFDTPYKKDIVEGGYITFQQEGKVVLDKSVGEETVSVEDNMISVQLSQQETLLFTEYDELRMQIRLNLKSGKRVASNTIFVPVFGVLREGEI